MKSIQKLLTQLTPAEIEHRDHPAAQAKYYDGLPIVQYFNGQPVYLFAFNTIMAKRNRYTVKLSNQLSDEVTLLLSQHSRYSVVPLHILDYIEINCVLAGSVTTIIGDHRYVLNRGDVCFIKAHTIHTLLDTSEKDIIINILVKKQYFTSDFLAQLPPHGELTNFIMEAISAGSTDSGFLLIHHASSIRPLINDILQEQFDFLPGAPQAMEAFLRVLFIRLTRQEDYFFPHNEDLTQQIFRYIQANFRTITLIQTANYFSFQPNYFSALVKKRTGTTFKQLVLNKRIEMAADYLLNTSWPISKILTEVGFSNDTFFYKKFKATFGVAPLAYRQHQSTKKSPHH